MNENEKKKFQFEFLSNRKSERARARERETNAFYAIILNYFPFEMQLSETAMGKKKISLMERKMCACAGREGANDFCFNEKNRHND